MKQLLLLLITLTAYFNLSAQIIDPLYRARRATENRVNRKIDEAINKGLDKAEADIEGKNKKKAQSANKGKTENTSNMEDESSAENNDFSYVGKFDFISGEKIIAIEDFSQDALGDFPAKWNTNGSGELVKLNNFKGKFLRTNKEAVFYPEFITSLPDNFTVEFDLSSTPEFSYYNGYLIIGFTTEANVGTKWRTFGRFGNRKDDTKLTVETAFHPTGAGGSRGMTALTSVGGGNENIRNDNDQSSFATKSGNTDVHISIWRQKNRLRVYIDENKVWDIPRAFTEGTKINSLYFRNEGSGKEDQAFFISNLKVAVGAPDTRNKLLNEGKFVTSGILFDVNSDKIKPESYGVIKDIANILSENEGVAIKIVGHTDSDGDDAANMLLSKKRAESVMGVLTKQFSISGNRITTDGKGESQPLDNNTTVVGKANNRRVEFIKM